MSKRWDEVRYPLPFWDKHPPSKRDALIALHHALSLLSEALPLAMQQVSSASPFVQINFWREFIDWDRRTDLVCNAEKSQLSADLPTSIGAVIEDWRELVEVRVSHPTGSLDDDLDCETKEVV